MDLSELDRIPPSLVRKLPPFWQRVYAVLKEIREEGAYSG